jgi:hypothetical protein
MRLLPNRISVALLVSLVALLLLSAAVAQETTAGIQGYVRDQSGAVVPKAKVEINSPALIGSRTVETDSGGFYRFASLPPGTYSITVSAVGFRVYKQSGIDLQVGRLPNIDISLQVGTTSESVEVTGTAPVVDVTQSKVAVSVDEEQLQNLPKGRSFQSVIPFAPGARQEPLQSRRDQNSGRDTGFQIDGASDSENVYLIDGMNTTDVRRGGSGKNFQMDFVQEVQIKSSSFEAEFGGAVGGVVNAVPKRGSNAWHGELLSYFRSNALNATDPCSFPASPNAGAYTPQSVTCFMRANPTTSVDTTARMDQGAELYVPKNDSRRILEPGFSIGGPILRDRLWLFTSYLPTIDTLRRTVNFTGANPGVRTFTQSFTQHNEYTRLDYRVMNSLRVFAGWNYAYSRTTGALPNPDSPLNQINTGASTDPTTLRADRGIVSPSSLYSFGADWTPTSRLVVAARYGYQFYNNEDRGTLSGVKYIFETDFCCRTTGTPTTGLDGKVLNQAFANTLNYTNLGDNTKVKFDSYKRRSLNVDASYLVSQFKGSHVLKGGYFRMAQINDVLSTFDPAQVRLDWGADYTPVTSTTACDSIISSNVTNYGSGAAGHCRGYAGYFIVRDGVTNSGKAFGNAQALYIQDQWTVGHGLTLNLGVRFDNEFVPPYRVGFRSVTFGWTDKVAPRIGGAYDLLHNGKVKVYASYGKYFDIMKLGLPRGSFGSDYWHDCVYALDDPNYNVIQPTGAGGHGCPPSGPAPGVSGRFIENVDFRKTKDNPLDPALDPNLKPMSQHEIVTGVDWAIAPDWSLETRYSRKRLDNTIEDMAITDNLGFYIGNPGSAFSDILHRQALLTGSTLSPALCPECPATSGHGAIRRYDGLEFRLTRRGGAKWFGSMSYTYSRLRGNYAGLSNTDITDGNGGRHDPNNNRAFDLPTMWFDANGKYDDGPLPTDRPHTGKVFGYYRLKWLGMETLLGAQQYAFQGSPLSTCLPVVGTSSACEWAEGRGNWVRLGRDSAGNIVSNGIIHNARTEPYFQTDFSIQHSIAVNKNRENQRLSFEANIGNLFNQRAVVAVYENTFQGSGLISTSRAARFPGDPGVDWNSLMRGFDYIQASNAQKLILFNRYGQPNVFQAARSVRLAVRFVF